MCFGSSYAAMNIMRTLRYSSFAHENEAGARLARGVTALELGEGMVAVVTSRLAVSLEQAGILPFSSQKRRNCGVATPKALFKAFCFGLHICFYKGGIGSQGT